MALRLDGLSVTKPKGLKADESLSSSLSSVFSWSAALAMTLALLLLPLQLASQPIWDLGLKGLSMEGRGEEEGGRLRGRESRAQAIFSGCGCWSLEVENQRFEN